MMDEDLEKTAADQERQKLADAVKKAVVFQNTFATESGKKCLEYLAEFCGFGSSKVATDKEGRVDPNGTLVQVGMENVYAHIVYWLSMDVERARQLQTQAEMDEGA